MNISKKHKLISLILKLCVIISAVLGTFLSAYAGRHAFMGGSRVFMYFTIQSNIAIAIICAIGLFLLNRTNKKERWFVIKLVGTVSITLTGVVFCFVLAPTMGRYAWNIQNILTHVTSPLAAIADFFVTGIYGNIKKKNIIYVTIPPLAYAIYAGIGYIAGWEFAEGINYPYFFLNWGSPAGAFGFSRSLPFMGCAWWILALLIFLICIGFLYLSVISGLKKRAAKISN